MTNAKHITRTSLDAARSRTSKTDWNRLKTDREPARDADDVEVDWATAQIVEPLPKKLISLRVDRDVLEFFKSSGKGYQTRINAVLRAYKDAQDRN